MIHATALDPEDVEIKDDIYPTPTLEQRAKFSVWQCAWRPGPNCPPPDYDEEDTDNMTNFAELKARLPEDFSGWNKDAAQWIIEMKAYFDMNNAKYNSSKQLLTTLNKMCKGWGASFSKGWYMKLADPNVLNEDKTFEKFKVDFHKALILVGLQDWARMFLSTMSMEGHFNEDFDHYKMVFKLE